MSLDELDKVERQRADADRAYNDALTRFDAALIHLAPPAIALRAEDAALPPAPAGWRGWPARAVREWLAPWSERQQSAQAQTGQAIEALVARDHERTAAFTQFQTALIGLLQQITAFVETKDRQVSAQATLRLDEH